jgi:hypothetical protein
MLITNYRGTPARTPPCNTGDLTAVLTTPVGPPSPRAPQTRECPGTPTSADPVCPPSPHRKPRYPASELHSQARSSTPRPLSKGRQTQLVVGSCPGNMPEDGAANAPPPTLWSRARQHEPLVRSSVSPLGGA